MFEIESLTEQLNHNYLLKILTAIADFHCDITDIPKSREITFDEALEAIKWFELNVVDIFDQKCGAQNYE